MFGVIRGEGFLLSCREKQHLMGHMCGMCLALNGHSGQVSRLATNYDVLLLSVLYEALTPEEPRTRIHYCPFRSTQRGQVLDPGSPGIRYAAAIALLSAAARLEDHAADRDGWLGCFPRLLRGLARHWASAAARLARCLGFDAETVTRPIRRQVWVEQQGGQDFLAYSGPTEEAVGAACRHLAVLTNRQHDADSLERIGRHFGRIIYLVDACRDLEADRRRGKFNPLAGTAADGEVRIQACQLFREAQNAICREIDRMDLPRPALARRLLIDQLEQVGRETFAAIEPETPAAPAPVEGQPPIPEQPPAPPPPIQSPRKKPGTTWDCADCGGCTCCWMESTCDGCGEAGNCCDCGGCDCGGCDCGGCSLV